MQCTCSAARRHAGAAGSRLADRRARRSGSSRCCCSGIGASTRASSSRSSKARDAKAVAIVGDFSLDAVPATREGDKWVVDAPAHRGTLRVELAARRKAARDRAGRRPRHRWRSEPDRSRARASGASSSPTDIRSDCSRSMIAASPRFRARRRLQPARAVLLCRRSAMTAEAHAWPDTAWRQIGPAFDSAGAWTTSRPSPTIRASSSSAPRAAACSAA